MKIGILTYHRAFNYGAFLQSVALCLRLNQEIDMEAEIIDFDMKRAKLSYKPENWPLKRKLYHHRRYLFKRNLYQYFAQGMEKIKEIRSEKYLCSDSIEKFCEMVKGKYDVIIAGSDEIWRVNNIRGFPNPYFLFGELGCRKFAYAVSARVEFDILDKENHEKLALALNDFEFISVRDRLTYEIVQRAGISSENMMLSCDPSLLYDFNIKKVDVRMLVEDKRLNPMKKTAVIMCGQEERKTIGRIRKDLEKDYNLITVFEYHKGMVCADKLDPFRWMQLLKSVDFVISSYFHGICFSITNNTPFLALGTRLKKSKIEGLLVGTTLENHYISIEKCNVTDWLKLVEKLKDENNFDNFVDDNNKGFTVFLKKLRQDV
ncbi:hypothetical protein M2145_001092 [Lachnospiraceae bacterium PF1-21]|uniref:Polysaccharide pyruvyl transferase family protein n=1 Tax=Ohessyouella blattaphilus TaxID=2949333 RepID=A0ABT1ELD1_9FIRM|nr:polysaccharide pyruvyl transferase family protein [Ohessyouella blattaphilus]MCP1111503.1 polysaccharide pyruvyl transferase family protein [Ohessyouella blattaphilus]MCR8564897.1 polysaccharide pyruvyl transferase family protein [Ohessyouella blattaphilus]